MLILSLCLSFYILPSNAKAQSVSANPDNVPATIINTRSFGSKKGAAIRGQVDSTASLIEQENYANKEIKRIFDKYKTIQSKNQGGLISLKTGNVKSQVNNPISDIVAKIRAKQGSNTKIQFRNVDSEAVKKALQKSLNSEN